MKLSIVGIVCFALISAASAQYFYSPALIEARGLFVQQHADALVSVDEAFFDYYEHARQTATSLYAPFQDAKDSYNAAIAGLDLTAVQNSSPQFWSLHSSITSGFDTILGGPNGNNGNIDPIHSFMQSVMGVGMDWSTPAQNFNMNFMTIMSTVVSSLTMGNPMTQTPKSDECINKVFGRVQAMYAVLVTRSLTDANEAINSLNEIKEMLQIYVDSVIEQLGSFTTDIGTCGSDGACLEALYNEYYFLMSSFDLPQQLSMSMMSTSQQYPGMQQGSDISMWLYNIAQMC